MSDKKTNRVSVFFSDAEFKELVLHADQQHREVSDYLRWLHRREMDRFAEALAEKLVEQHREREENQRQLDALSGQQVASVDAFRRSMIEQRDRQPWEGREDSGFPRTVATGSGGE